MLEPANVDVHSMTGSERVKGCLGFSPSDGSRPFDIRGTADSSTPRPKGVRDIFGNRAPGYLDLARVVLLSGKEGSHKIYLHNGVWADLVLVKDKGGYRNLEWTFPDIRTGHYNDFFLQIRAEFKKEKSSG